VSDNNKLAIPGKLSIRGGLAGKLQQAKDQGTLASESLLDFKSYPNRIVIAVDDSGSMSTSMKKVDLSEIDTNPRDSRMELAKQACKGFLDVCNPSDTVLGMYTISTNQETPLHWNYKFVDSMIKDLTASGGTPTFEILQKIITKENVTRVVLISDGCSNSGVRQDVLKQYKSKGVIIDAVFIGTISDTSGISEMKQIAEATGGMFLHFTDAKDFASKFKYLAPAYYGMLTSGELKV
jgi:hypothetical protein